MRISDVLGQNKHEGQYDSHHEHVVHLCVLLNYKSFTFSYILQFLFNTFFKTQYASEIACGYCECITNSYKKVQLCWCLLNVVFSNA